MKFWRRILNFRVSCVPFSIVCAGIGFLTWQWLEPRQQSRETGVSTPEKEGHPRWNEPSPDAIWPWTASTIGHPTQGVTHWQKVTKDGTTLELVRFDFKGNPRLRFEMYDQDEEEPKPWSNKVRYFERGVAPVAAHLNSTDRGKVIVATNGLFFHATGYDRDNVASHVSPVVVNGEPHFTSGENVRWTFGVKYTGGQPKFAAYHRPDQGTLTANFDFAAGGAQVLIWDGVVAASPAEHVGYDSAFENMRTTRVAWGWSRDNRNLYLLFVEEPDRELGSKIAAKQHSFAPGGWMLSDVRRFFKALGGLARLQQRCR